MQLRPHDPLPPSHPVIPFSLSLPSSFCSCARERVASQHQCRLDTASHILLASSCSWNGWLTESAPSSSSLVASSCPRAPGVEGHKACSTTCTHSLGQCLLGDHRGLTSGSSGSRFLLSLFPQGFSFLLSLFRQAASVAEESSLHLTDKDQGQRQWAGNC